MARITIDGIDYEARDGENLLHAVLSQAIDLPYFCWHPAMGSVGACRQCAVIQYADEEDTRGRLTMACMTPVSDGLRISVAAAQAEEFRTSVIEWLMENHPHDCPVCEEGGECHLQDMTVMTGHSMRRFNSNKRTWRNQDLGPFIGHEMNRCITCYRCVRFYGEYAGGTDLAALGSRSRVYFGRVNDGTLESEFSGNLVEVCPTGVFTDKPFSKSYSRKWDLQSAPSICPGCSVGCNTFASERYGTLKRLHNRYNGEVNGYFLCDRGRFGSHFVNSQKRIRYVGSKAADQSFEYGNTQDILQRAAAAASGAIGIGSPRASVEANFALQKLVGKENFCTGLNDNDALMLDEIRAVRAQGGFHSPSPADVEDADAILILGEDISNTAARLALAVRQAVRGESFKMAESANIPLWQDAGVRGHAQHAQNPLFIAVNSTTRIDDIATAKTHGTAMEIAQLGFNIAAEINTQFAAADASSFARDVAEALQNATKPLIISGTGNQNTATIQAAANIAWALSQNGKLASLLYVAGEANSMGSSLIGGGLKLQDALQSMQAGRAAIVLENDLYRRADRESVDAAFQNAASVICLDSLHNPSVEKADFVFPAATYAEQNGSFVNYETRAQRFFQVFQPADEISSSWRWLAKLAATLDRTDLDWATFDDLATAVGDEVLAGFEAVATNASYRVNDQVKIPRQTHRYSGRTAMHADHSVHEPKTSDDAETPFSFSMEGENPGDQAGSAIPYVWTPGWNSNQSVFKFQAEVAGPLKGGNPGVVLNPVAADSSGEVQNTYRDIPTLETKNGKLLVTPSYSIFGSDELSSSSWPIAQRSAPPSARLNGTDAETIGASDGTGITLADYPDQTFEVIIDPHVAVGTIAISMGFPGADRIVTTASTVQLNPTYQPRPTEDERILVKD